MLKVSGLFILLCGLLASSSAQEALSRVSSQITNGVAEECLHPCKRQPGHPGGLLTNRGANLTVQIKDLRLLQVCLENSPNFKGVKLRTPLAFSIQINVTPMKQIIVENVDRVLRDLIINNLGAKI
ncbi:hypothetical protein GH733_010135 [Mirounga leonina]|nr:hypothetical protein GH733_010135 [Mirounga leonina]